MSTTKYKDLLRAKNLKATKSRLSVLGILGKQKRPLDIEMIRNKLGDTCPNNVTLYRMMEDLSGAGIVRQIDLRQGRAFFELMPQDDHHHIVCVSCEKVEDIHGCILGGEIDKTLHKSKNFDTLVDHVFEIFAICKDCKG